MIPTGVVMTNTSWAIGQGAVSVGTSLYGREQRLVNPAPLWRYSATARVPTSGLTLHAFEAWLAARHGGALPDDILPDDRRMSGGSAGLVFTGGAPLTDGAGFLPAPYWQLTAPAAQFARSVTLDSVAGIVAGRFVWINGSMHQVAAVSGASVSIAPGLRKAASSGQVVTSSGSVSMQLVNADTSALVLDGSGVSQVDIQMVEIVT